MGKVAAGAMLWGCWSLFLRPAALPGAQSAWVALLAMSVPAPFVLDRRAFRDRRATAALVVAGLADAANVALFFAAMQRGSIAVAVLTHYLAPLLIALFAPLLLSERRSARALIAAPVTLLGLALLVGRSGSFSLEAALLGAASAVFYAAIVLSTKVAARAYSPLAITALHAPISALALALVAGRAVLPHAVGLPVVMVFAGGAFCGLCGTLLFNSGLRFVPASAAAALTYLEPLTAAVLGWLVFGEALGLAGALGGILVLAAGIWAASEPREAAAGEATAVPSAG